ncbi:MAG: RbsD/FucU family protein [Oscillospiraceae bacterium]
MLKTSCINTEVLAHLAKCGHGDQILIASANFPMDSQTNPAAKRIYLGVSAGIPSTTQVLEALAGVMNIETAKVLGPQKIEGEPEPWEAFREFNQVMPGLELERYDRYPFYDICKDPSVRLVIQTGDQREYANVLVTMTVVRRSDS